MMCGEKQIIKKKKNRKETSGQKIVTQEPTTFIFSFLSSPPIRVTFLITLACGVTDKLQPKPKQLETYKTKNCACLSTQTLVNQHTKRTLIYSGILYNIENIIQLLQNNLNIKNYLSYKNTITNYYVTKFTNIIYHSVNIALKYICILKA